ncbi:hypothetical protein M433DRAFT_5523 [Acidomyces richmondensis BFW]|nr:MAG: hypothetical protein FE78DRAFT_33448 [Acidomyces sp. 'richmondensis']KYG44368.1 hypothetical protein M433DRAFT_5523 [Acidomyces richmondensis BFW]
MVGRGGPRTSRLSHPRLLQQAGVPGESATTPNRGVAEDGLIAEGHPSIVLSDWQRMHVTGQLHDTPGLGRPQRTVLADAGRDDARMGYFTVGQSARGTARAGGRVKGRGCA